MSTVYIHFKRVEGKKEWEKNKPKAVKKEDKNKYRKVEANRRHKIR